MEPTRARGSDTPSLIDLIITEDSQTQVQSSIQIGDPLGKSDHAVLQWRYLISTNDCEDSEGNGSNQTENVMIRNFKKGDFCKMNSLLSDIKWEELFRDLDVDDCVTVFYNKINELTDECIPLQTQRKLRDRPPWMTKRARKAIRKKGCAWKRYINSSSYNRYMQYVKQRNKTGKILRKAKRQFEKKLAKESKKNPKALFRYANYKSKTRKNVIRLKDENGMIKVSNEDNANLLNSFFESVYTDEPDAAELLVNECSELLWGSDYCDPFDYRGRTAENTLESITITEDMILEELKKIDPFKSNTKDCIHPKIIKEVAVNITEPLKIIYDMSLSTSKVPERWKKGTVTPLHKGEDRHEAQNYRPVSITSVLCRIMERILKKSILRHICDNNILIDEQHGFVSGRSCLSNLLMNLEELTSIYDEGDPVDEIFLDLQKAFDTVPHQRLLYKLRKVGIQGELLEWIRSFLTGRKQRVAIQNSYSRWCDVKSGVPQGSVLGPVLFIIFINDLPEHVKASCSIFADDTKLLKRICNLEDADDLQEDLTALQLWSETWRLSFNPKKCHVLHIGKSNKGYLYHLNNHIIPEVKVEKDLGVIVSEDMKAEENVAHHVKKATKMLGIIKRTFSYLNEDNFLLLYKTYVRPHLEYCQQACHPYLLKDTDSLEKVQRRATKLVPSIGHLSYEDRLKKLKLYTLCDRRMRADMIAVYKIINGITDVNMSKIFTKNTESRTRGHQFQLKVPGCTKTDIRRNFFSQRVIVPWNQLPEKIVNSSTAEIFKREYDNYMLKGKVN